MYRTDKQFMKNPATAGSRIYIGGIPKTVIADDLEAKFKCHGNILGLVLQTGFAFIQYENEFEAQSAIRQENGTVMHGRKISVKQAMDRSKGGYQQNNQQQQNQMKPNTPQRPMQQNQNQQNQSSGPVQQTPPQKSTPGPKPNVDKPIEKPKPVDKPEDFKDENMQEDDVENEPPPIRPPVQKHQHDGDRGRNDGKNNNRNRGGRGGFRGSRSEADDRLRFEPPIRDRDPYRDDYYGGRGDFGRDIPRPFVEAPIYAPPPIIDAPPPDRNDCEIIVVSKALTEYAEFIEQRLKQLGLIVDLLFPNEDVPIGKVLANISSRGCLFAILIMPQNEEHRSLTLNILHGIPQEHRNMPIEDALILISRNFEAYMRGETDNSENAGQMRLEDKHPLPMQTLFNLLAENRQLTTAQYDKLLKYLEERRELQSQHEIAEGIEPESQGSSHKQTELQNRIMNILNKSASDSPIPASITSINTENMAPNAPPPNQGSSATPLLKDPTVQKALDSLLLGDMFKNISGV